MKLLLFITILSFLTFATAMLDGLQWTDLVQNTLISFLMTELIWGEK